MGFPESHLVQFLQQNKDLLEIVNPKNEHTYFMEYMDDHRTNARYLALIYEHYQSTKNMKEWFRAIRWISYGKGGFVSLIHRGTCEGLIYFFERCGDIAYFSDAIRGYIRRMDSDVEKIRVIRSYTDYFEKEQEKKNKITMNIWTEAERLDAIAIMTGPKRSLSPPPTINVSTTVSRINESTISESRIYESTINRNLEILNDLETIAQNSPERWRLRMALDLLKRWRAMTTELYKDPSFCGNKNHDEIFALFRETFASTPIQKLDVIILKSSMTHFMQEGDNDLYQAWRPMYDAVCLWVDVLA